MNPRIITNISEEFNNITIQINAPKRTEELDILEKELITYKKTIRKIVGKQNNSFFILEIDDVISFFSREKNNYCKTKEGEFRIKEQLYYLEEVLPSKNFIRISNSAIINVKYVRCFNTNTIGKIIVELKDGSTENVSQRKNKDILKFLKNIY